MTLVSSRPAAPARTFLASIALALSGLCVTPAAYAAPASGAPCQTSMNQTGTSTHQSTTAQPGTGQTMMVQTPSSNAQPGSNNSPSNVFPTSQPSMDVTQVNATPLALAKADAATARAALAKAQSAFSLVAGKLQKEFEAHPDVVEATRTVTAAKTAYDAAANPVLASLKSRSDFSAALNTAYDAQEQVASLKGNAEATPQDRLTAAKAALAAKEIVTRMQTDALSSNAQVTNTKAAYASAIDALAKLRQQFADSLKQDAQWVSAKEALANAKAKSVAADQAVASAQKDLAAQQADALAQQRQLAAQQAQAVRR